MWGRDPIIILLSKVPWSGPVQRSRGVHAQGGNSLAPDAFLKKPLCTHKRGNVLVTAAGRQCDVESFCAQRGHMEGVSFVFVEVINK